MATRTGRSTPFSITTAWTARADTEWMLNLPCLKGDARATVGHIEGIGYLEHACFQGQTAYLRPMSDHGVEHLGYYCR